VLWTLNPSLYEGASLIEAKLGYVFASKEILFEAITHRSALACVPSHRIQGGKLMPWNERLEFLGDSVLGLVIAEALLASDPGLAEGQMSRVRASIVCEKNLASIARENLELGKWLVLGESELASGGREKSSILADALEAILGAVFSDGGWDAVRRVTRHLFSENLAGDLGRYFSGDSKTLFQEQMQASHRLTPSYEVVSEVGPAHKRSFVVAVKVGDEIFGQGSGISKKDAAQAAARNALLRTLGGSL
jgi:ribonuclease III